MKTNKLTEENTGIKNPANLYALKEGIKYIIATDSRYHIGTKDWMEHTISCMFDKGIEKKIINDSSKETFEKECYKILLELLKIQNISEIKLRITSHNSVSFVMFMNNDLKFLIEIFYDSDNVKFDDKVCAVLYRGDEMLMNDIKPLNVLVEYVNKIMAQLN
jgi:hypothetical protein